MKQKGRDYSQLLILAALVVTLPRFSGAFIAADMTAIPDWVSGLLSIFMGISGLGMGFLDVLGVAYVFDGWRKAMPRNDQPWPYRYKILTGFVAALFVVGIGILAPFTVARMTDATMADTLPGFWRWLWSVAVMASPYLLIGGIITGQSGIVTIRQDASNPEHNASITKSINQASLHVCKKCGASFGGLPELASHNRWQHPKEIAVHQNGNGKHAAQ
jgi:hypothetical protein